MGSSAATAPSLAVLFLAFNLLLLTLANENSPPPTKTAPPPPTKTSPPPPTKTPPPPFKAAGAGGKCPMDALKLGVCANVLSILNLHLGNPPKEPCCSLLQGLADAEVATCLCLALKANVLGINLNLPINLSLLINYCGKEAPTGFQCY